MRRVPARLLSRPAGCHRDRFSKTDACLVASGAPANLTRLLSVGAVLLRVRQPSGVRNRAWLSLVALPDPAGRPIERASPLSNTNAANVDFCIHPRSSNLGCHGHGASLWDAVTGCWGPRRPSSNALAKPDRQSTVLVRRRRAEQTTARTFNSRTRLAGVWELCTRLRTAVLVMVEHAVLLREHESHRWTVTFEI